MCVLQWCVVWRVVCVCVLMIAWVLKICVWYGVLCVYVFVCVCLCVRVCVSVYFVRNDDDDNIDNDDDDDFDNDDADETWLLVTVRYEIYPF